MWLVVMLGVVMVGVVAVRAIIRADARPAVPSQPPRLASPRLSDVEAETARMLREAEAAAPGLMREVEAEVERRMPEIEAEAARLHAKMMREAAAEVPRLGTEGAADQDDEPEPRWVIRREGYAPKEDEARYLTRGEEGLPTVRLGTRVTDSVSGRHLTAECSSTRKGLRFGNGSGSARRMPEVQATTRVRTVPPTSAMGAG